MPTLRSKKTKARSSRKSKGKPWSKKAKILCSISCALVLGGGVLVAARWRAWFGNKPEKPYRTAEQIDRLTITPGKEYTSERTISWRCGEELTDSWVEYGLAGQDTSIVERKWLPAKGQDIQSRSGHGCFYQAQLYGLQEGRTYRYRVHSGKQSSKRYDFTIPNTQDSLSFVYLGDVQDPQGSMSRDLYYKLNQLVNHIDFLAVAGDQIEGPANEYWNSWYKSLGESSASQTIIAATGNHEYLKKGIFRELDPRWTAQYGFPINGPEGFEGRSYFIDLPLVRFIVLDSNGITSPSDILSHRMWLGEVLRGSAQPWQIVMFHHAIYNVREGRMHPIMRYAFRSTLEEDGADLILQGHDHAYSRISTRTEAGDSITPVYIVSSSSPKVYRNGFDEIHDRLGSGLQLYQHIRLSKDELHYRSHEYNGAIYDEIKIRRTKGEERHPVEDLARGISEKFEFAGFGSDKKGRKKAKAYQREVAEYLERKQKMREQK